MKKLIFTIVLSFAILVASAQITTGDIYKSQPSLSVMKTAYNNINKKWYMQGKADYKIFALEVVSRSKTVNDMLRAISKNNYYMGQRPMLHDEILWFQVVYTIGNDTTLYYAKCNLNWKVKGEIPYITNFTTPIGVGNIQDYDACDYQHFLNQLGFIPDWRQCL